MFLVLRYFLNCSVHFVLLFWRLVVYCVWKLWRSFVRNIISKKRVGKQVSAEMRFLDTNHRWVLNKRSLRYGNGSCRLRKQFVAAEQTGMSMDATVKCVGSWNPDRSCGTNRRVHRHNQPVNFSVDTLDYISGSAEKTDSWFSALLCVSVCVWMGSRLG
jgi:hypothetical protein